MDATEPDNEENVPIRKTRQKNAAINGSTASSLQEQRNQLPITRGVFMLTCVGSQTYISSGKEALIREIRENDVTMPLGETGSGKTSRKELALHSLTFV